MRLTLISPGRRMPAWVEQGYLEYARRMPKHLSLDLVEISSARKSPQQIDHAIAQAVPKGAYQIALCIADRGWSTEKLSTRLAHWQGLGRDLAFLVGAADGLGSELRRAADEHWSLGPLTLPHTLVRIVIAEQLYRASTILAGHPYHRG